MDSVKEKVNSAIRKLKQPGLKRQMFLANAGGIAFYWVVGTVIYTMTMLVALPTLYADNPPGMSFHRIVLSFLWASMMINYMLSIRKTSYYEAARSNANTNAESASKGWAYCTPCQQYMPPRCRHCPVCDRCILKRDSHCFFTGHCIGHRNQRYFLVFVFYTAFGGLYSFICLAAATGSLLGTPLSMNGNVFNYLYPFATGKWLSGYMAGKAFALLSCMYMCTTITVGCFGLFGYHFRHVLKGQTSYEAEKSITKYRHTTLRNVEDVFSRFSIMCFLLPIPFALPSNGITWNQCKEVKGY